jgi:hypothetical protein
MRQSFCDMKFRITPVPWGPTPTHPTAIRSLGETLAARPKTEAGTTYGKATAPAAMPADLLRKPRRVRRLCPAILFLLVIPAIGRQKG